MNNFMYSIMAATAWSMTPPKAYGVFHLTFFFGGLAVCFLLAYLLRNVSEKGNKIVLIGSGTFLIITEIYKQLFYTYYIGQGSYQWWIFPFQLCSVPMYLAVISPLVKNEKVRNSMYGFLVFYNFLGGFIAFLEPSGLVHEYWTLTLHAFIWHMTLVFIGLYIIFSGRCHTTFRNYIGSTVTFLCLCIIAFVINVSLGSVSDNTINMFFVGPKNSSLVIIKDIAASYGWYVGTLVYVPAVCLGAFLLFLLLKAILKKQKVKA